MTVLRVLGPVGGPTGRVSAAESVDTRDLLLSLHDIGLKRDERVVLDSVSLDLRRGEILTVIGPNGAGKTCLIRIALGLLAPDRGLRRLAPGLRIGYVPQKFPINPYLPLTVADFLALPGALALPAPDRAAGTGANAPRARWWRGGQRRHAQPGILAALAEVGAEHLLMQPVQALSGGEQQRVLLARALLRQPDLLVLDEPVQGVDLAGQAELYALIRDLRDRHGCGVLMVSHDLHVVMAAADQVLCLNRHVCCTGHPEAVSQHPEYQRLFGLRASSDLAIYTHHHDHHHTLHGDAARCGKDCHHD